MLTVHEQARKQESDRKMGREREKGERATRVI